MHFIRLNFGRRGKHLVPPSPVNNSSSHRGTVYAATGALFASSSVVSSSAALIGRQTCTPILINPLEPPPAFRSSTLVHTACPSFSSNERRYCGRHRNLRSARMFPNILDLPEKGIEREGGRERESSHEYLAAKRAFALHDCYPRYDRIVSKPSSSLVFQIGFFCTYDSMLISLIF